MRSGEVLAAWRRMLDGLDRAGSGTSGFLTESADTHLDNRPVRIGVASDRNVALLVPSPTGERWEQTQGSSVIAVQKVALVVDGVRSDFLSVACHESSLREVFARVVSDIVSRIERGRPGATAINEALLQFRRLLRPPRGRVPERTTAIGLVGELLVLCDLLEEHSRAWAGWQGPESDRHDFRAGSVSIESKAGMGADAHCVHVHGLRQLESPPGDTLILRHIRLEPDPAGELTVPDLAVRAADLSSDPDAVRSLLEVFGYAEGDSDEWRVHRFRHAGATAYRVMEGFPRLVPDTLNVPWPIAGIDNVSYEVDLAIAGDYRLTEGDWADTVREFCTCL